MSEGDVPYGNLVVSVQILADRINVLEHAFIQTCRAIAELADHTTERNHGHLDDALNKLVRAVDKIKSEQEFRK